MNLPQVFRLVAINVLVGAVALVVALIAGEVYLRVHLDPKYAPRPIFIGRDERTGWSSAANLNNIFYAPDYSMEIRTDDDGYRLGTRGRTHSDDSLVVLVGDSYTFGWGVSTSQTFASYLDEKLATIDPRLRVVNTAVSGYATLSYADRLADFISKHGATGIHSIFVLHVDNDPSDNVDYLLFRSGFYEPQINREYSPRSSLRVWNYLTHALNLSKSRRSDTQSVSDSTEYDVNFRYPMSRTAKASGPLLYDGEHFGDFRDFDMQRETSIPRTKASRHLTPLQLRLMRLGLKKINCVVPNAGLTIHHAVINLADAYTIYADAMNEAFKEMPSCANDVRFHGLIQLTQTQLSVPAHNAHSGGHFTPAFNRIYADILFGLIMEGPPR